jgi:hypothetical protein
MMTNGVTKEEENPGLSAGEKPVVEVVLVSRHWEGL